MNWTVQASTNTITSALTLLTPRFQISAVPTGPAWQVEAVNDAVEPGLLVTSLGLLGSASSKAAATTIVITNSTGALIPAGTFIHIAGVWDNVSATTPTLTCSTIGGATAIANHVTVGSGATSTAGTGIFHRCFSAVTTGSIAIGATIATLTSNQSAVARAATAHGWSGATATPRGSVATVTHTTGSPSIATSGTAPIAGDLVIGTTVYENPAQMTGDADVLNGAWSAITGVFTTGSTANTNVGVGVQSKVANGFGVQTYNPTGGVADTVACVYALVPATVVNAASATLAATASTAAVVGAVHEAGATLAVTAAPLAAGTAGSPVLSTLDFDSMSEGAALSGATFPAGWSYQAVAGNAQTTAVTRSASAKAGTRGARFTTGTSPTDNAYVRYNPAGNANVTTKRVLSFYLRVNANPVGGQNTRIAFLRNLALSQALSCIMTSSRQLSISGATSSANLAALALGSWYRVEIGADHGAGTAEIRVYLGDSSSATSTGTATPSTTSQCIAEVGQISTTPNFAPSSLDIDIDHVRYGTDWLDPYLPPTTTHEAGGTLAVTATPVAGATAGLQQTSQLTDWTNTATWDNDYTTGTTATVLRPQFQPFGGECVTDLTNWQLNTLSVRLRDLPLNATGCTVSVFLMVNGDITNALRAFWIGDSGVGTLTFSKNVGGTITQIGSPVTWDLSQPFLRLRQVGAVSHLDRSADGANWTNVGSDTTGLNLASSQVRVAAYSAGGDPHAMEWVTVDALNSSITLAIAGSALTTTASRTAVASIVREATATLAVTAARTAAATGVRPASGTPGATATQTTSATVVEAIWTASGALTVTAARTAGAAVVHEATAALAVTSTPAVGAERVQAGVATLAVTSTATTTPVAVHQAGASLAVTALTTSAVSGVTAPQSAVGTLALSVAAVAGSTRTMALSSTPLNVTATRTAVALAIHQALGSVAVSVDRTAAVSLSRNAQGSLTAACTAEAAASVTRHVVGALSVVVDADAITSLVREGVVVDLPVAVALQAAAEVEYATRAVLLVQADGAVDATTSSPSVASVLLEIEAGTDPTVLWVRAPDVTDVVVPDVDDDSLDALDLTVSTPISVTV